jgi:hypothetical protein
MISPTTRRVSAHSRKLISLGLPRWLVHAVDWISRPNVKASVEVGQNTTHNAVDLT